MEKNQEFTVSIEDMSEDGAGIGKLDGYIWFIKDAVIGDVVRARAMKMKKNYGFARLMEILTSSEARVEPKCPVARQCGGCQLQAMSYEEQLKFNERKVKNHLLRIGKFKEDEIHMLPIMGMKEPWRYRKEVETIMDKFLRLRHQMIPYLHTMNRRASEEGIPLIQPLYYQNPGKWDAFRMKNEYYFGSDILVNPITQPISTATRMGKVMTLLPEGTWIDLFTGTVYNGDREIELYRSLDSIPVLAKAGAIVTLDARTTGNKIDNPDILKVIVAAGADGSFRLDEEATDNVWCSTTFTYQWGDEAVLTITPEKTKLEGMPAERAYELVFAGTAQGMTAQKKKADGTYETLETSYDSDKQCTTVILPMQDIESEITVVTYNTALADNHQVERIFELLNRAEIEFSLKEKIYAIAQKKGSRNDAYLLDQLTLLNAPEDVFGAVKEILTALD